MSDWLSKTIGTAGDAYGDEVEVCVDWNADEDATEQGDEPLVVIRSESGDVKLDQEGAEAFAALFVSACWEAARLTPKSGQSEAEAA